jgi:hypothetical protein
LQLGISNDELSTFRQNYPYTVKGSVIAIIDLDQGSKSVTAPAARQ